MLKKRKVLSQVSFNQKTDSDLAMSKQIQKKIGHYDKKSAQALIKVEHLQKIYNEFSSRQHVVLWDINFTVFQGDCIALVGANGSGKSTLIEILACVREASCGKIYYNLDYKIYPEEKIGIQFQKSSYPTGITVNNVIDFILDTHKIKLTLAERKELLHAFGLNDLAKENIRNLSGGQRQRVNVVLSILHKPQFLLLDELTTGLDIVSQNQILSYLKAFLNKHKITTIMSSHSIREMDTLCNRLIMIRNGYVMADARIDVIHKKFGSVETFLQKYMGG
ncbi:MAG: ABC transporter ATP-binding protein [Mycoplasmataceae bacterium]|jgi:ABC-2 type transport system ATP-binding protein|nr:ABC transporter ATP-binding protein [Mycoplasmataceae bacterium]